MKLRSLVLAMVLLVPSLGAAEPISTGVWSALPPADGDGFPFWDGDSWDGPYEGVGYLLEEYSGFNYEDLEYLHDGGQFVAFTFNGPIAPSLFASITAWTNGVLTYSPGGAFTYSNGMVPDTNSVDNPEQFALFRHVGPDVITYFLGVEDIPFSLAPGHNDLDYNDYVVTFTQPVPEPSTLLLLGTSLAGLAVRKMRGRSRRRESSSL